MKLSDLFDQLSYGELSQLEMGGADNIGISYEDYHRIVPHINLGLLELHKRFPIRIQEVIVQQYDHIQTYTLHSRFATSNTESTESPKYIMDSAIYPFADNILKIEKVFNEDGQEYHLNETDPYIIRTENNYTSKRAWSVHTPAYNKIQIPYPMAENTLLVEYRAAHDKILIPELDPEEVNIDIPAALLEALLFYIAARVFTSMGGDNSQVGMVYMQKFEASCKLAETYNLFNEDNVTNQKLEANGWV